MYNRNFLYNLRRILRGRDLSNEEKCMVERDLNLGIKLWKPLRKLYRQDLISSLLPKPERAFLLSNTISVLNIATSFYCKKQIRAH